MTAEQSDETARRDVFTLDGIRDRHCDCEGYALPDSQHSPSCVGLVFKEACLEAQKRALWEASLDMRVPVSRVAVEFEVPECHAKRCYGRHPTGDEIVGLIDARYRDELQTRSIMLGHVPCPMGEEHRTPPAEPS